MACSSVTIHVLLSTAGIESCILYALFLLWSISFRTSLSTYCVCLGYTCSKADVTATDTESYTPLMLAVQAGHMAAFDVLLRRGSVIDDSEGDGKTIVHLAAEEDHVDILKVCVYNIQWNLRITDTLRTGHFVHFREDVLSSEAKKCITVEPLNEGRIGTSYFVRWCTEECTL